MAHDIANILQQDHERLDRMLEDAAQAVQDARWEEAAKNAGKLPPWHRRGTHGGGRKSAVSGLRGLGRR